MFGHKPKPIVESFRRWMTVALVLCSCSQPIQLPRAVSAFAPAAGAPYITISRAAIRLGESVVATVNNGQVAARKKQGDLLIVPLFESLAAQAAGPRRPFVVHMHRRLSCRLLYQVLYTAGQAGFDQPQLLVDSGGGRKRVLPIFMPRFNSTPSPLAIVHITATRRGLTVQTGAQGVAGLLRHEVPVRIPLLSEARCADRRASICFDTHALVRRLEQLRLSHPNNRGVIIALDPELPYQALIEIIVASQRDRSDRPLFPVTILTMPAE